MRKILILTLFVTLLVSCGPKWQPLFNGKDLEGWKILGGKAIYEVVDGEIVGVVNDNYSNTFLATEKEYQDFILEFDFLTEGINSGVQIRSKFDGSMVYGCQFEIDPIKWSGGIYYEGKGGWLYLPHKDIENINEGWNKGRIEALGNRIRTWVNGRECSNLFVDKEREGFIALQVHACVDSLYGRKLKWRNLRIITEDVDKYVTKDNNQIDEIILVNNYLTEREKSEGWKFLWNGKDFEGWKQPSKGWNIKDGILTVEQVNDSLGTGGGGDIYTLQTYGNFMLKFDFKLTPGANSGVKYFIDPKLDEGQGSSIGCEFQILDDKLHPDAKCGIDGNRTLGSLYDLITAEKRSCDTYTSDGWHTGLIVVNGPHVEHWLNGVKVLDYDRQSQQWDALVAYSKYHKWKGTFGNFNEGHILLQDHSNEVHFRNIKIKEL